MYVYFCVIVGCRSKLRLQQQWSISVPTIHRWLVQQVWRNSTFFDSSHTWNVSSQLFINRAIYSLDILWNVFIFFLFNKTTSVLLFVVSSQFHAIWRYRYFTLGCPSEPNWVSKTEGNLLCKYTHSAYVTPDNYRLGKTFASPSPTSPVT